MVARWQPSPDERVVDQVRRAPLSKVAAGDAHEAVAYSARYLTGGYRCRLLWRQRLGAEAKRRAGP